jgi:hypothetical protein
MPNIDMLGMNVATEPIKTGLRRGVGSSAEFWDAILLRIAAHTLRGQDPDRRLRGGFASRMMWTRVSAATQTRARAISIRREVAPDTAVDFEGGLEIAPERDS